MDATDIKILSCLKNNARMNASEIGERINMSVSAVGERIKKLEASGVIKQYTLILDPKLTMKGISAFISVGIEHPKFNEGFEQSVRGNPLITEII